MISTSNGEPNTLVEWFHDSSGRQLALVVRADFQPDGVEFLTPDTFALQVGYMSKHRAQDIEAHIHQPISRATVGTQEVIIVRSGKIVVNFFEDNEDYVGTSILGAGDLVLLTSGGHSFEVLEESVLIEVKQGPYANGLDKRRFKPASIPERRSSL